MPTIDDMASRALDHLRSQMGRIRWTAEQEPYAVGPDDFSQETWIGIGVRKAQDQIGILRGWGADWLSRQPESVQREVDEVEREISERWAGAVADGARLLQADLPDDPFSPSQ